MKADNNFSISFSFISLVGFFGINCLLLVIPVVIVVLFFNIADFSILQVVLFLAFLSVIIYAFLYYLLLPRNNYLLEFLGNGIISYGSLSGTLFGTILAIGIPAISEKIIIIIGFFIWGSLLGSVSSIIIRNYYSKEMIH
jgi:hypothetical protein